MNIITGPWNARRTRMVRGHAAYLAQLRAINNMPHPPKADVRIHPAVGRRAV